MELVIGDEASETKPGITVSWDDSTEGVIDALCNVLDPFARSPQIRPMLGQFIGHAAQRAALAVLTDQFPKCWREAMQSLQQAFAEAAKIIYERTVSAAVQAVSAMPNAHQPAASLPIEINLTLPEPAARKVKIFRDKKGELSAATVSPAG